MINNILKRLLLKLSRTKTLGQIILKILLCNVIKYIQSNKNFIYEKDFKAISSHVMGNEHLLCGPSVSYKTCTHTNPYHTVIIYTYWSVMGENSECEKKLVQKADFTD